MPYELVLGKNYDANNIRLTGNFFRIDITSGNLCSGTTNCYFSCYNPTNTNPPAFHYPGYFVDIVKDLSEEEEFLV